MGLRGNEEYPERTSFPRSRFMMWSGPRNLSTAMMYAFHHRGDTKVVDEPYYAFYLKANPDIVHPGREDILQQHEDDLGEIKSTLLGVTGSLSYLFVKNMPKHVEDMELDYLDSFQHIFLIREPGAMIRSFIKEVPDITMQDMGYDGLLERFQELSRKDKVKAVLDCDRILENPEDQMKELCDRLGIPFKVGMVKWPAGPIPEDGVWAEYWYSSVRASNGFEERPIPEPAVVPERYLRLHEECRDIYDELLTYAL